jgi:hypothetical protein
MVMDNMNQSRKKGVVHTCIDGRIRKISEITIDGRIIEIRGC